MDAKGDRAKAISLLDESRAMSSKLGMRPLMRRVPAGKPEIQGEVRTRRSRKGVQT